MKRLQIAVLSACSCVLVGTSCSKSAGDDTLANTVKANLYSDETTKPAAITVAVKNGVVTLSGDVASSDVALEAMRVANGTAGVRSVADQLTVNGASNQLPNAGNATTAPPASSPYPAAAPTTAAPPPPVAAAAPSRDRDREHDRERDRDRDRNNMQPNGAAGNMASSDGTREGGTRDSVPRDTAPPAYTVPAGTAVSVRTIDPIDSGQNQAGQTFQASLSAPITVGDRVVVPAGSNATLLLSGASSAGKIKGRAELQVVLSAVSLNGRRYDVSSTAYTQEGSSRGKNSAVRTGVGAVAGALIGGLAGGGKGAGIGAAAGGGAGLGSDLLFKDRVKIPSETVINFRLQAPLTIR